MTGRPLLAPAVGFLAGVSVGLLRVPIPAACLVLLPLVLSRRLAPLAFAAAGWLVAASAWTAPVVPPSGPFLLGGRIVTAPDRSGDRVRFRLRLLDGAGIDVAGEPLPHPLALGDAVQLEARARAPPAPRNPGGRDEAARLGAAGVRWQASATGPIVRVAPPSPAAPLERAREALAEAARRWLPAREAALVQAIGAGDRSALDAGTARSFARSGLAHVLAVSGFHLVVVIAGLERLLRALLLRWDRLAERIDARRAVAALLLPCAALYALATGAGAPVLRAALASGLALGGVLLDREAEGLNGLGLAALVLLAAQPAAALDASFQLSFAAVAGLALWARPLRGRLPVARSRPGTWRARLLEPLLEGACATAAASIATAPVLAFHFRQLPLLGLPANVAAIPLGAGLTVLATAAGVAAAAWPPLAVPFLFAARPLATGLLGLSDLAAAPAWGVIGLGSPGLVGAIGAGLFALAACRCRRAARTLAWIAAAACLFLPAPLRAAAARARGGLEVIFLSVGQGDAALLRLPDGSAVLVDGGGAPGGGPDPGARHVVPLLRDLGVRRLAAIFVSHPHPDHVLGLAAVREAFPVGAAFSNGAAGEGEAREVFEQLAPVALLPGQGWARAGVRFDAVGGERAGLGENDASLVLRVSYGETALLFAGDLEGEGEAAAVARGGLRADVVKVPHHGSRSSSSADFIAAVGARSAVICAGTGNRFGFPHAEVLARWRRAGAQVVRTDQGAARFLSDGARLRRMPPDTVLDPLATWRERP
jgi:competence protein ComEC